MGYSRPKITGAHIDEIKRLIQNNPGWHRSRLSIELCKAWDWRGHADAWKDISCRDLLRDLDAAGLIALPPARHVARVAGAGPERVEPVEHRTDPIETDLRALAPLRIEIARAGRGAELFKSHIAQYHSLGYGRSVGENMKYMIRSGGGEPLACMMFGSAAWKCRARDEWIGWDDAGRRASLQLVTNNSRFLILPWVRVPHLASHALAAVARRLPGDWQAKYGHSICLIETFVERGRFRGICYKAANWACVGQTAGRGRNDAGNAASLPIKDVWLRPLRADFRDRLRPGANAGTLGREAPAGGKKT
jgi:hypothetical protein